MPNRNLWELGTKIAANPSMWTRIKHPGKGTSIRRVGKRSSIPAAIARAGSMALKQVPVPVLKDVLAAAVDKAYEAGKKYYRTIYQINTAVTDEDRTKFGWKDMDVKDMDRYRWKVADSVKDFNATAQKFSAGVGEAAQGGAVCDAFMKLTRDHAYAMKRSKKLRDRAFALQTLCSHTLAWLDGVDRDLLQWAKDNKNDLTTKLSALGEEAHTACDSTVCALSDSDKRRLQYSTVANAASGLGSLVSGAFDPMEFFSMAQPNSHKIQVDNMYTGEDYK